MNLSLDHIIIAVHDLERATADYQDLGFTVIYGGEHAAGTTHNALVCFRDGTYFELLAPTGKSRKTGIDAMDFAHLTAGDEGFVGFALYADELDNAVNHFSEQGLNVSPVTQGSRTRQDGVVLRWRTATLDNDLYPFVIQDETARHLRVPSDEAVVSHANGAQGIAGLAVPDHHERITSALAPFTDGGTSFTLTNGLRIMLADSARVTLSGLSQAGDVTKTHGIHIEPA